MRTFLLGAALLLITFLGVAAIWAGQVDDAPGLGGLGFLLIGSAALVLVRTARSRGLITTRVGRFNFPKGKV